MLNAYSKKTTLANIINNRMLEGVLIGDDYSHIEVRRYLYH